MNAGKTDLDPRGFVQSLDRGLAVLELLNRSNGATAKAVASEMSLHRVTAYRLLETLKQGGYVTKTDDDPRYWLADGVRRLASGYTEQGWIVQSGQQLVSDLGEKVLWPITLATFEGTEMVVRATSAQSSPFTTYWTPVGTKFAIGASAAGTVYLAFCETEKQQTIVKFLSDIVDNPYDEPLKRPQNFLSELKRIRESGYAIRQTNPKVSVIGIPVITGDQVVASLCMSYFATALKEHEVCRQYLDTLREAAFELAKKAEQASLLP